MEPTEYVIGKEENIYIKEILSHNVSNKEIDERFNKICKLLNISEYDKIQSMKLHFVNHINLKLNNLTDCQDCINGKKKVLDK